MENNMISYSLNNSGIFHVKFSGAITVEDIKRYLLEFKMITSLPQDFKSLYDLRDADLSLTFGDILAISRLTKKVTAPFKTVRTAFLVSKPNVTAYSILFSTQLSHRRTVRKVFSTEGAALDWLK